MSTCGPEIEELDALICGRGREGSGLHRTRHVSCTARAIRPSPGARMAFSASPVQPRANVDRAGSREGVVDDGNKVDFGVPTESARIAPHEAEESPIGADEPRIESDQEDRFR